MRENYNGVYGLELQFEKQEPGMEESNYTIPIK
jgi:hypothetical protein